METSQEILAKYLPAKAVEPIVMFLKEHKNLFLRISRKRTTKLGDYRMLPGNRHQISVNYDLNPYQFLLTLLHEIAHYFTFKEYGRRVKPHGKEWKKVFGNLIEEFIVMDAFPEELVNPLKDYASNPKASTGGDGNLYLQMSKYDTDINEQMKYIFELPLDSYFSMENGEIFHLQEKRRTRYKCRNLKNYKIYLVHKNARVLPVNKTEIYE